MPNKRTSCRQGSVGAGCRSLRTGFADNWARRADRRSVFDAGAGALLVKGRFKMTPPLDLDAASPPSADADAGDTSST